jgi:hypothetical protein
MKVLPKSLLVLLALCLSLPVSAMASKPVSITAEGCVEKGVFYMVDKKVPKSEKRVTTETGFITRAYKFEVQNPDYSPFDLSLYEGKKIQVQGRIHPGDLFIPDPKTLKVLGPCDQESKDAISKDAN